MKLKTVIPTVSAATTICVCLANNSSSCTTIPALTVLSFAHHAPHSVAVNHAYTLILATELAANNVLMGV